MHKILRWGRNCAASGAIVLAPLMLIIYPYWIRFSAPNSFWNYIAWILIAAYPVCVVVSIIQLVRGRLLQAFAFSAPIILTISFLVFPSFAALLSSAGFQLYRISHRAEFSQCTLAGFYQGNREYFVGACLRAQNQEIPGFYGEATYIIYDDGGMILRPTSEHTVPWKEAVDQYVYLFGYAYYVVNKISGNYFYVGFDMSSYGPGFNSNF